MSLKVSEVPGITHIEWRGVHGLEVGVLPDGRIWLNENVGPETADRIQVHDDEGQDYIRKGDPTVALLYKDAEAFLKEHGEAVLGRIQEDLEWTAASLRSKLEAEA